MRSSRVEVRRDVAVIVFSTSVLFFLALGARDLWNPNEPVYGEAVAEMAARGDWLVPTVNGRVFPEKPILYYWLALAASRGLGGVSELSIRAPSALAGVVSSVLLYFLVLPYAGRRRALLSVALLATTFTVFWNSRTAQMDILVMATTLGVVLAVTRILDHDLSPSLGWTLAGVGAGLGLLSKALVGLILPGLVLVAYVAATRRWKRLADFRTLLGLAAMVVVAAPWLAWLATRGHGEFLHELFYRQHFERFVDPWDHQQPWWYFLSYFWIDMAPWSWFVPLAVALPQRDADERRLELLAWLWISLPILLFSLSASKRSAYILPIAPAVAILAAGVAHRFLDRRLGRGRTLAVAGLLGLLAMAAGAAGAILWIRVLPDYPDLVTAVRAVAALLVVGGGAVLLGVLVSRRSRVAAPTAAFFLVLVFYVTVSVAVLPAVDAYKSARPFCERVASILPPDSPIASFGMWQWRAGYTYYLGRPIPNLETTAELSTYLQRDENVFVIVQSTEIDEARAVLDAHEVRVESRVGSRTVYLFSNR